MRSSLIEIQDIGPEEAGESLLMEDQEVIQAFSPHASQKALTDGIGLWRTIRRSKHLDAARCCYARKIRAEFAIIIPNQVSRSFSKRSCLPQLLRDPGIRGGSCHIDVDDLARFQFDDEEGKERTKEEIGNLQESAGPHVFCMVAQESFPGMATDAVWASVAHLC